MTDVSLKVSSENKNVLRIGIDVGSTTVKLAVIDKTSRKLLYHVYKRHNARQLETVRELLEELRRQYPAEKFRIAVCGSGGKPVAEAMKQHFVQEVVANAAAVQNLYPDARTAIELGGQDAKVIFFSYDEDRKELSASDMRMNGSCAGGTGAFLDEMAALFHIKPEELNSLAAKGKNVYEISGRCGVFAKTDIQPLLIQGAKRQDVALSIFHAVAKQTIGGLAQGLELLPPIIFEGGPLTFNDTLIKVFAERLGLENKDIIIPEHPETIVALGTAMAVDELYPDEADETDLSEAIARLEAYVREDHKEGMTAEPFFENEEALNKFRLRHDVELGAVTDIKKEKPDKESINVYIGIDSGSTTSKAVIMSEDGRVLDRFYYNNNGEPLKAVKRGLIEIADKYEEAGIELNVLGVGTTGYGEMMLAGALRADFHCVETVAHAAGCLNFVPDASFILDIGGQDMKAIRIRNGVVTDIALNEACSSGCGSFLENFAASLGMSVGEIAEAAFRSKAPAKLGSRCTVFMNSAIINEQRNGKKPDDIMAGLCRSIIENVFTKVIRISDVSELGNKVVVQGGTFRNLAVLRAIEEYLGQEVVLAPYPGEMGALGAALSCRHMIETKGYADGVKSSFIGFDAMRAFDYSIDTGVACTGCANRCSRTILKFNNGDSYITGNRCERGAAVDDDETAKLKAIELAEKREAVPDVMRLREQLLFKKYPYRQVSEEKNKTIAIPKVVEFWDSAPFWSTFFGSLGFKLIFSSGSNQKQYEAGIKYLASDTVCFPAKLVHGHIAELAEKDPDRIFMPYIMHMPPEYTGEKSVHVCPVLMGYPLVVRNFQSPDKDTSIVFDTPEFHWFTENDRERQIIDYAVNVLAVSRRQAADAFAEGKKAIDSFKLQLSEAGRKAEEYARSKGTFAVVLAGRPYHTDSYINHSLSRMFTSRGIPVLTVDSVPGLYDAKLKASRAEITNDFHARMIGGAMAAAKSDVLEYVQIVSFGCGHDAILSDEITRIMSKAAGKAPLILKLDESEASGALGIRVKSFIETVSLRREKLSAADLCREGLPEPYETKYLKSDKKKRLLLIPNISGPAMTILSGLLRKEGIRVKQLPVGGEQEVREGKRYTHNDICFPCQMVVGELISELKKGNYDQDEVAVGMAKLNCDCRLANYSDILRQALDKAGFSKVPILSTDPSDTKRMHPGVSMLTAGTAVEAALMFTMLDILEELLRKIRPYELRKGEANSIFESCIRDISEASVKGFKKAVDAFGTAIDKMSAISYDRSELKPGVLVTGELLVTYHPGTNYHIEEYLEEHGCETILPRMTNQFRKDFLVAMSEIKDFKVRMLPYSFALEKAFDFIEKKLAKIAARHPLYEEMPDPGSLYEGVNGFFPKTLSCGEGWLMAGEIAHFAKKNVRSFVILQPFGCLPNHVCGRGISKKLKEMFPGISILPLDLDPDTSYANMENRLQMLIMNRNKETAALKRSIQAIPQLSALTSQ